MRVVEVRNVSEAWARLPGVLIDAEEQDSRAGKVLVCPEPVTTVYLRPTERVLRDPRRDANPFFHLVEALWMLAGRDDAATLNHYVRDFGARFGDGPEEDRFIHGAYGHRWRNALDHDQLDVVVDKLRRNPLDRQAVIQMWDASDCNDLVGEWNDRPCNTHVYLRVQNRPEVRLVTDGVPTGVRDTPQWTYNRRLDMTVCCRSNDMVFGGYGANAVHFSVLQEYLAARIGVGVGTLTQVSNNFHVYRDVWLARRPEGSAVHEHEEWGPDWLDCAPMVTYPEAFDEDLETFFRWHDMKWGKIDAPIVRGSSYNNSWFIETALPLVRTAHRWRHRQLDAALASARSIECPAWQAACVGWLMRRGAE